MVKSQEHKRIKGSRTLQVQRPVVIGVGFCGAVVFLWRLAGTSRTISVQATCPGALSILVYTLSLLWSESKNKKQNRVGHVSAKSRRRAGRHVWDPMGPPSRSKGAALRHIDLACHDNTTSLADPPISEALRIHPLPATQGRARHNSKPSSPLVCKAPLLLGCIIQASIGSRKD